MFFCDKNTETLKQLESVKGNIDLNIENNEKA